MTEKIDLDKVRALGGRTYNHSGQIISADAPLGGEWLFLGDDYEQYSAMDALVRDILDNQSNWLIHGEIVSIEDDGDYLIITTSEDDLDENLKEIKTTSKDYVRYRHKDCGVLVNHTTNLEITVVKKKTGIQA